MSEQTQHPEVPSFSEAGRAARDALNVVGRKASATINELSGEARDTGSWARDEISRRVESQPLTSVLVAAGVGLIAGLLLSRH